MNPFDFEAQEEQTGRPRRNPPDLTGLWLLAAGVVPAGLGTLFLLLVLGNRADPRVEMALALVALAAGVTWLVLVLRHFGGGMRCPACGRRGVRYAHQRGDGGRDRRYRQNPAVCLACGWRQY